MFMLIVLGGLVLALGCGKDNKVIEPTNVPEKPKGPPGSQSTGGGADAPKAAPNSAKPVSP